MKTIFLIGNCIYIRIDICEIYAIKEPLYMLCGRSGQLVPNALVTQTHLETKFPDGKWFSHINPSNTCIFDNK